MRNFLHYLFSVLLWILFGYYWYVVFERQLTRETLYPVGLLFALTALGLAITLWWIAHNKRIAAKGKRKNFMAPPAEPFEKDNLERPVVGDDLADLRNAAEVIISLDEDGNKVYRAGPEGSA